MHTVARSMLWTALVAAGSSVSQVAFACPDYSLNGTQATYTSDQLETPVRRTLSAGGDQNLSECSELPGSGWMTRQPDFTFRITGNASKRRRLQFRTQQANCDTVLLVNTPTANWIFDDDGGDELNAKVDIPQAADGIYDIWVGTVGAEECQTTLVSQTFTSPNGGRSGRKVSR